MTVKGNLTEISLTGLVQLNCHSGMTGRLTVSSNSDVACIFFYRGDIVHATLGQRSGQEVFYEILGWESGQFELDPDVISPTRTIAAHWSDLLLGGLHQLDENNAVETENESGAEVLPDDLGKLFGLERINDSLWNENTTMEDEMSQSM